jgi:uncharacterized damage-inducible protein DinB
MSSYAFLLDTYETEILKITGLWLSFPDDSLDWRPHPKSRSIREQMEHQCQSEAKWMRTMLDIDTGDPNPAEPTREGFVRRYAADAGQRLATLRAKPDEWWREEAQFFDVRRSRAWIVARRINHSTHHRGQLVVYLRLLDLEVPSVYGPTADTGGVVKYKL